MTNEEVKKDIDENGCFACGYKSNDYSEFYTDGCIDCMGKIE